MLIVFNFINNMLQLFQDLLTVDLNSLKAKIMVAKNYLQNDTDRLDSKYETSFFQKYAQIETTPNLFKLFTLTYSILVFSTSCDRSFTTVRRINNYIRSTIT